MLPDISVAISPSEEIQNFSKKFHHFFKFCFPFICLSDSFTDSVYFVLWPSVLISVTLQTFDTFWLVYLCTIVGSIVSVTNHTEMESRSVNHACSSSFVLENNICGYRMETKFFYQAAEGKLAFYITD